MKHWLVIFTILFLSNPAFSKLHKETINYKDGEVALKGYLFWEDSFEGKRPGIMVVHEWWGLNDYATLRAEMLAELGYVAFAADMYGDGKVTRHAGDAKGWKEQITSNIGTWQRRALLGLEQLKQNPKVDSAKMAAVGYCFGGATVMQMAYSGAELRGVASFHGSLPPATAEQAGKIKARVLIAHGDADGFVPDERIQKFKKALSEAGVAWEMNIYGGAKHSFTNPYANGYGIDGLEYHEAADRSAWLRLLRFLDELLGEKTDIEP
jgi:dienelactone hydrolase